MENKNPILNYKPKTQNPADKVASLEEAIKAKYPSPTSQGALKGSSEDFDAFSVPVGIANQESNKVSFKDYSVDQSEIYTQLSDGTFKAKHKNFISGTDNNERLALQQSTGEKWANGTAKAISNFGAVVLGNTVGSVVGLGELITTGSVEAMYNNDFNQWLNGINEELRYDLPNLYTKQEQEEGFFGSLDSANFWANDFLGGVSFTLGTIVGEAIWTAATGGAGLAASGARMAARAGFKGFKKAADLAKANSAAAKVGKKLLRSKQFSARGARNVARGIEGANTLRFTYTSAAYEAGVEASGYMRETRDKFYYTFEQQNGREPSPREVAEFEADLKDSANTVFATNTALVGASNLAIFGRMFDVGNPLKPVTKKLNKNIFGIGARETTSEGRTVLEALKPTKLQKFAGHSNSIIKGSIVEGVWEEGMQAVTSNGAESWLMSRYDEDATRENLDMVGAAYDGLAHTYGTKEGWKEIGLGMLIGLVGGGISGQFSDYSNAQKDNKQKIDEFNTFSIENTLETFQTQNQVSKATKDIKEAEAKNDLLGKDMATKKLLYTTARANIRFGKKDSLEDFKAAMEGLDDSYFESVGLDPSSESFEQDKQALKEDLTSQYQNVHDQYKTNIKTAEYLVGKGNIGGVDNTAALIDAVAYNITMGENADQFASQVYEAIEKEMTGELGTKIKGGIKINTTLENAHKRTRERFYYHKNRVKKSELDLERALKELKNLQSQNRETNVGLDQKIQKAQAAIEDHTRTMSEEKALMRQTYGMAQAENHFSSVEEGGAEIISDEDLLKTEENLQAGEEYLDNLKETNPTKHQALKKLFNEYHRANYAFRQFNDTVQGLANSEMKLNEYNDFISKKIFKGKENNEFTKEWISKNLQAYQESLQESVGNFAGSQAKTQADRRIAIEDKLFKNENLDDSEAELYEMYKEEIDRAVKARKVGEKLMNQDFLEGDDLEFYNKNKAEVDSYINKKEKGDGIKPKDDTTPTKPKTIMDRIKAAIKNDTAVQSYVGEEADDVMNKKPTMQEVDEFTVLDARKKASETGRGKKPNKRVEPLSKEEEQRHEELLNKLANWRIVDGSIDPDGYSLADLIRAKEQEDTEPKKSNVKSELTEEEMIKLETVEEQDGSETKEDVNFIQTYENVKVKVAKNKKLFVFSHLNIASILNKFSMDNITYKAPTGKDKGQLTPTKLNQFGKREGSVFEITLSDGSKIQLTIRKHGRISISIEDFSRIQSELGFKLVNTNLTKNSYYDVYEEVEVEGKKVFLPKKSDFKLDVVTGAPVVVLQPQELEKLEKDDELTFEVNPKSVFNNDLLEKIQSLPEDQREKMMKEVEETLEIYVKTSDGRVVGVVKIAPENINTNSKSQPNHKALRQHAAKLFMEQANTMSNAPIELGATIPVSNILLGSPNLELKESEDGLVPVNIELTDKALDKIQDFGYLEGDTFKTNGNSDIKGVITSAVTKLAKDKSGKVPFVIFNHGNRKIAYPVSLVTSKDFSSIDQIESINNSETIPAGEKILRINDILLENGIQPKKYSLMNTPASAIDSKIDGIVEELSNKEVSPDLDNWVNNAEKSVLKSEARISIDLTNRPLKSPKLAVSFAKIELPKADSEADSGAEVEIADKKETKDQQDKKCDS